MSVFATYAQLGFGHIINRAAFDHILFLLALAAIYRPRDWRAALWVVSAFTVGHSLTLALAVSNVLVPPAPLIEFLIPVTIVATGIANLRRERRQPAARARLRPLLAGAFGLVHGAGFAGYLRSLFVAHIALPLLGFNVGIELGQIVVLASAAALFVGADRLIGALPLPERAPPPLRIRVVSLSTAVAAIAGVWAVQRAPW